MGQTFYFIDGFNADRASKKLMRRHVMKGKNTGKTLHRPSRLGLQVAQRPANTNQVTEATGNPLLTFSFPVEVTPYAVKIIDDCKCTITPWTLWKPLTRLLEVFSLSADRLYPVQLGLSLDEAKRKWFRFLFADESSEFTCSYMNSSLI